MSDREVYMLAPLGARQQVHAAQERALRLLADARDLGMPTDTFREIKAARDREIGEAIERESRGAASLCQKCGEVWRGNVHRCAGRQCVRCGRPAPSEVCANCTAGMSQGALEGILRLIEKALAGGGQ